MADLISREAVIEQLELLAKYEDSFSQSVILGVVHTIKCAPSVDAVEVVRCGECKNKRTMIGNVYHYCVIHNTKVYAEDFCSYGERKEDNVLVER